jgi:hypothetical protein
MSVSPFITLHPSFSRGHHKGSSKSKGSSVGSSKGSSLSVCFKLLINLLKIVSKDRERRTGGPFGEIFKKNKKNKK